MDRNNCKSEGVVSWTSYHPTAQQTTKADSFMKSIDFDQISQTCSEERYHHYEADPDTQKRIECTILDHWAMGMRSIVVEARFADGVRWAVKFSMTCLEDLDGSTNEKVSYDQALEIFQDEFTAMSFIRNHTKIPVPKPHFVRSVSTLLGPTVCLAMDLIPGVSGSAFFSPKLGKYDLPTQKMVWSRQNNVLKSLAEFQTMLASYSSFSWGSLGREGTGMGKESIIVQDYVVRSGPQRPYVDYTRPMDFYDYLTKMKTSHLTHVLDSDKSEASSKKVAEVLRTHLPSLHDKSSLFYLTNLDLGGHNTIFSADGKLQAIIDVDSLWFVPIECAARPPARVGLDLYPNSDTCIWRLPDKTGMSYLEEYADMLVLAGKGCEQPLLGESLASVLLSDSAVLVAGLFVLDECDTLCNSEWLNSQPVRKLRTSKSTLFLPKPSSSTVSLSGKNAVGAITRCLTPPNGGHERSFRPSTDDHGTGCSLNTSVAVQVSHLLESQAPSSAANGLTEGSFEANVDKFSPMGYPKDG